MAAFFGDLERLIADLYPYRWAISGGVLVALAALAAFAYRKGWHMVVWQRRRTVAIVGTPMLMLAVIAGWYLGSPLFIDKRVEEEFPFALNAVVPPEIDRLGVELIMSGMSKVDQEMSEAMPLSMEVAKSAEGATGAEASQGAVKLKTGNLRDADKFHKGRGGATIYRGPDGTHLLRLENLDVTNGPDLHVILTPHGDPESRDDVHVTGYIDLGKLKGNKGNQNYEIPDSVNVTSQGSVVIYCKPFHVIFSVAPLQDVN